MIINQMYFLQIEGTAEVVHGELSLIKAVRKGYGTCAYMRRLTLCKSLGDEKGRGGVGSLSKDRNFLFPLEALINFLDRVPCLHGAWRVDPLSRAWPVERWW